MKASLSDEIKLLIISFQKDSWEPALLRHILKPLIMFHRKLMPGTKASGSCDWALSYRKARLSLGERQSQAGCSIFRLGQPCVLTWSMTAENNTSKGGIMDRDQNESKRSGHSLRLAVVSARFAPVRQFSSACSPFSGSAFHRRPSSVAAVCKLE